MIKFTPVQINNCNQILKKEVKLAASVCLLYQNSPSLKISAEAMQLTGLPLL